MTKDKMIWFKSRIFIRQIVRKKIGMHAETRRSAEFIHLENSFCFGTGKFHSLLSLPILTLTSGSGEKFRWLIAQLAGAAEYTNFISAEE